MNNAYQSMMDAHLLILPQIPPWARPTADQEAENSAFSRPSRRSGKWRGERESAKDDGRARK
ncbi:MAG: hypothetical protein ACLPN5_11030 [Roseiarcus sp.]